jgi:5-methylcytosine-specific restriction protein A
MTKQMLNKLLVWIKEDKLVKFYQSGPWRKLRATALRMYGNKCTKCGRKATMVHHKKKVKDYPLLALQLSNVEPQCNKCHNKEHPEKLSKYNQPKFMNEERW